MGISRLINFLLVSFVTISTVYYEEPCYYDDKRYDHGDRRGAYVCRHGEWIRDD